jgi:hypothetical protein
MTTTNQREHMARLMDLLVLDKPEVHYREIRPMPTCHIKTEAQLRSALQQPNGITMDCSESVTLICKLAGLHDPNGRGYNCTGDTGTMLDHLNHYADPRVALVGALVVFGPGRGEHVCMVRTPGRNPTLFSHGQERGPFFISLSEERKFHNPPVTFLSIAKL